MSPVSGSDKKWTTRSAVMKQSHADNASSSAVNASQMIRTWGYRYFPILALLCIHRIVRMTKILSSYNVPAEDIAPATPSNVCQMNNNYANILKKLRPDEAPNGIVWQWEECARMCSLFAACEFSTLQLSGDKQCLLLESSQGRNVTGTSSPASHITMLDEPFVLDVSTTKKRKLSKKSKKKRYKTHTNRIVVTSAVVECGRVVFVLSVQPDDVKDLPGFQCLFKDHKGGVQLSTELEITFKHLRYYRTTWIWTCQLPVAADGRTVADASGFQTVSVVPPSPSNVTKKMQVKNIHGTGTFNLQKNIRGLRQQEPQQIVSCGAAIHNINNETLDFVKLYFPHYRRLGVDHFTFYAEETEPGLDVLQSLLQDVSEGYDDISLYLFPVSYRELDVKINRSREWRNNHQHYAINDCLWRERSNGANWTMMQYDLDEFLFGIPELKSFLSSWPHDGFIAPHYLPQEDIPSPNGGKFNVSSKRLPDWGKSVFRTEKAYVAWVHSVTNPELHLPTVEQARLLHFRRNRTRQHKMFAEKNMTWVTVDYDGSDVGIERIGRVNNNMLSPPGTTK